MYKCAINNNIIKYHTVLANWLENCMSELSIITYTVAAVD